MLTLLHAVWQILCLLCVFSHKLDVIVWIRCSPLLCLLQHMNTFTVFLPPPPHIIAHSPSSSYSCVRPPATGYPTGPYQSDSGCGWHSGPQLCGNRKPHPHHPVEEGWCPGVHTWLQGETAGHRLAADTLCKGKTPAHIYNHAQIPFKHNITGTSTVLWHLDYKHMNMLCIFYIYIEI